MGARDFTRGSQALIGVPRTVDIPLALLFVAIALMVCRIFRDSLPGLELRAAREDEPAARAVGVDVHRRRLLAWTLSACIAAVAGVLLAHELGVYSPREFYFQITFAVLVMLIVGGMTSVSGAVAGAVVVTILIEVLRSVEEAINTVWFDEPTVFGLTDIGLSLAILGVLFWRRNGLFNTARSRTSSSAPARPRPAPSLPRPGGWYRREDSRSVTSPGCLEACAPWTAPASR